MKNKTMACGLETFNVHPQSSRKRIPEYSNYRTIALISHQSKMMLQVMQQKPLLIWSKKCQMFKVDLENEETLDI